jgi:hypothetical protein
MAKKARKKSAAKGKRKSRAARRKPAVKKKARAATAKRKKTRKARPKSVKSRLANAYHTVVDTVKGTDQLRNKYEPPATSETE